MVCYAVWFNHRDQRAAVAAAGEGVAVYGYAAGVDSAVGVGAIDRGIAVYGYAAGVDSAVGVGAIDRGIAVHGCCIALAQRFAAPVEGY